MKKKIIGFFVFLLLIVAIGVAGFFVGRKLTENEKVESDQGLVLETETVVSGEIIRDGLSDIGELATEEYYFTEVENYNSTKKFMEFNVPLTTTKFVYSYDGLIKAGIDFTAVEVEKDDLLKLITVKLPKSKILSSEIDENSFKLYDEKQSIFNQVSVSNFNDTNANLKERAEKKAVERGLLEKADENAVKLVKNFLNSTFDVSDYAIKVITVE